MKTHTKRRRFAGLPDVPACRVCIVDDLIGECREFTVPVSPDEALRCVCELETAKYFADRITWFGDGERMSLGVSLRQTPTSVSVRWFAVDGDDNQALREREDEWDELTGGRRT